MSKAKLSNVAAQITIEGEGFDEWGDRYFKLAVKDSNHQIPPFSVAQLMNDPKPLFTALGNAGWNAFTQSAQRELLTRLETPGSRSPTFKVVTRLGWNSGAYVFPDEIIGKPRRRLETAFGGIDAAMRDKYRVGGTLAEWQDKIARPCTGNSRLMFAVSLAFAGPVLPLVTGPKAGGFQLWGLPESGKTSAAMVAGSVWGCHRAEGRREKGFAESWHSTAGKVELTALAHNDGLLILDETKRAGKTDKERAEVVVTVAFGLAEQTEKERMTNLEPARAWRCYFLSTSNFSLAQWAQKGRVQVDEAEFGRMADVPMPVTDHGIYETLHNFDNGEQFSDALQRRSRRFYGTAIRAFVKKLVKERRGDAPALKAFLAKRRKVYRRRLAKEAKGLQALNRVSGRFATVFAAGSLAIRYGILPWNRGQLLQAIVRCQVDQLGSRGNFEKVAADNSIATLRSKLVQYLKTNRAQFIDLTSGRPQFDALIKKTGPGFVIDINGISYYCLTEPKLTTIVGKDSHAKALKHQLANDGLLIRKGTRFVVQQRLFDGGTHSQNLGRVHAFKPALADEIPTGGAT